jgi:hypothetical protein
VSTLRSIAGQPGVDHRVLLPAADAHHLVAGGERRRGATTTSPTVPPTHHRVQGLRLRVALAVVHAPRM